MHALTLADQGKAIDYAHQLLAETLKLNARRDTYIAPEYIADMSMLNAQLDALCRE